MRFPRGLLQFAIVAFLRLLLQLAVFDRVLRQLHIARIMLAAKNKAFLGIFLVAVVQFANRTLI